MKKTLIATTVVLALTLTAAAAQKKPAASQHKAGVVEEVKLDPQGATSTPPGLCNPCVFYGGDLNVSDSNAAGLSDENTLLIPGGSSTYTAINVPNHGWIGVTGILVNVQADVNFDPNTAGYDVRTGVVEGNGGTSIASGTGTISVAATGRNFIGLNEYTVLVRIPTLYIGPGEYWFNVTPQCTNAASDGSCSVGRIFISNTTQNTNGVLSGAQPAGSMYLNSSYFGFTWANWCDASLGLNSNQCRAASWGLIGSAKGL